MTKYWMSAALLTSAIVTGCGGGTTETTPNPETPAAPPAAEVAPAPEPRVAPAEPAAPPAQDAFVPRRETPRAPRTPARPARTAPPDSSSDVAPSREPVRAPEPRRPTFRDVSASVGTSLSLTLITPVSTETATIEMPVTARLRQSVMVDGFTVLPAGATLHGNVTEVDRAGRVKGRAHLAMRFTEVTVDGQRDSLRTNPISFEGEATKSEDATKVGAGAGIGAVIGGILGGGSGAAKGAAIGGAAGAGAVVATRGRDVELLEGAELSTSLASPFSIRVQSN